MDKKEKDFIRCVYLNIRKKCSLHAEHKSLTVVKKSYMQLFGINIQYKYSKEIFGRYITWYDTINNDITIIYSSHKYLEQIFRIKFGINIPYKYSRQLIHKFYNVKCEN